MKAPAFQFYPDDFIGGTVDLSAEDAGCYIRLLCYQWGRGTLPEAQAACDRIAGCKVSREVMMKFPDGKNPRLESERSKQAAFRQACAEAGRRGGGNPAFAKGQANPYIKVPIKVEIKVDDKGLINSPSPSPSPISDSLLPPEPPAAPGARASRRRNPMFDALAAACGLDPLQMTSPDARACGVALAAILKVSPATTSDEFHRRASNYRSQFSPSVSLTPSALCRHWSACDKPGSNGANGHPPRRNVPIARAGPGEKSYNLHDK